MISIGLFVAFFHPLSYSVIGCRAHDELVREAKSHKLNHPNIVKLYAVVFERKHYGVLLEFVPHKDIKDFIYRNKVRSVCFGVHLHGN